MAFKAVNAEKGHCHCIKVFNTKKGLHYFLMTRKVFNTETMLHHFLTTLKDFNIEKGLLLEVLILKNESITFL